MQGRFNIRIVTTAGDATEVFVETLTEELFFYVGATRLILNVPWTPQWI
jgi:hypothetical protein